MIGNAGRHAEAIRLLRRGQAVLEEVDAANRGIDWTRTWIRLMITLAMIQAELTTTKEGTALLVSLRPQIEQLPEGSVRSELSGFVDHNLATVLMRAGRDEEGLPLLGTAIVHKERAIELGTDEPDRLHESLITSLILRGLANVILGHLRPATGDLNRAVDLAMARNLPMRAAQAAHNLGDLSRRSGDIPGALRRYERAERIYLDIAPGILPRLRVDQAHALLASGLADEAGRYLDEVLPGMDAPQDLAEAEVARATAAMLEDDLGLARKLALSARRRFMRRGNEAWAAVAALLGLRVDTARALAQAKIPAALPAKAMRQAADLTSLRLLDEAALARTLAARLEVRRRKVDQAAELLAGVRRPGPLASIEQRMLLRLTRAELAAAQGNRRKAFAQARAGLAELGQARDRMGALELVSGTAIHGQELGDLAVRLVLDGGDSARRMFGWLERTRAQMYRYEPVSGIEDPQLVDLIAEIRSLGYSLRQARLDGRPTAALRSRYAERQRAAMRLGWHAASRWGQPRPVAGVGEVSAALGRRVLVSFAVSGDEMLAVVVVDGRVRLVRLGAAARAVESARRLHADLNAMAPDFLPGPLFDAVSASAHKQADALDTQLMKPINELTGNRDLVIVPTGALYAVPWGVLESLRGRPVVVAPSATAWLAATRTSSNGSKIVLVRGPGLTAAVGEIDKLAAHHDKAILLAGNEADVKHVLAALDGAELAHIAAHGEHEADNALFSKLELVDGALFAHELARLRRPPKQVVLAACELALNRIRPGDEALGFAGALLAGGVNTVVAAASRVGDQPAAAAMDDYHQALAAGAPPAVALAEAVAADPLRRPFICLGA
ncbi:CHAT domain-containing protein [Actinocrispum wychmicini]|uniref:CHAT domain-containing protein n=1 Tax=Actinocrispum wychmicini TaxID=1213861 RepID=A0A4R2K6B3_9PSEU|nr:CHAT domain-containing protein [Actinocrispum wychmicini]